MLVVRKKRVRGHDIWFYTFRAHNRLFWNRQQNFGGLSLIQEANKIVLLTVLGDKSVKIFQTTQFSMDLINLINIFGLSLNLAP